MTENTSPAAKPTKEAIASLNDAMRHSIHNPQGFDRVIFTAGIAAMVGNIANWTERLTPQLQRYGLIPTQKIERDPNRPAPGTERQKDREPDRER